MKNIPVCGDDARSMKNIPGHFLHPVPSYLQSIWPLLLPPHHPTGSFKPEDGTVTSIPLAPTTTTVFKPTSIFSQGLTGSCDANTGYAYLACHMVVQECVAASA